MKKFYDRNRIIKLLREGLDEAPLGATPQFSDLDENTRQYFMDVVTTLYGILPEMEETAQGFQRLGVNEAAQANELVKQAYQIMEGLWKSIYGE